MKYYKLTDKNNQTRGWTIWGENVTHKTTGKGNELCSEDVIHVYDHPLKAVMFNPVHADFESYNLWECRVKKAVANDGMKVGVKQCTTTKQVEAPEITLNQRVRFAIYCALEVYRDEGFEKWAQDWLSGNDRSAEAAWAAEGAAWAAEAARAAWGAEAAEAAARAARAALGAARAAWAAEGAAEAAWPAEAAARAARAALGANIDFFALIKKAVREE